MKAIDGSTPRRHERLAVWTALDMAVDAHDRSAQWRGPSRCKARERIAFSSTTIVLMLPVLAPLAYASTVLSYQ